MIHSQSLLLVLSVPFLQKGDQLLCEAQACNGLERWADNFDSVVLAAPVMPDWFAQQESVDKVGVWRDVRTLDCPERFEMVPLPWAYSLSDFMDCVGRVRSHLADLIARCDYLQFGVESLIGDWAAVAALEAIKQGRPFAIHKDVVNHKVLWRTAQDAGLKARLKAALLAPVMRSYHHWLIRHAELGLWHGADTYMAYHSLCPNSYLIHDVHSKGSDLIGEAALAEKRDRCLQDVPLHICYAGRMVSMKAPVQWVKAIGRACEVGVNLKATWIGDGCLRSEMEATIAQLGLGSSIELVGFEADHQRVLEKLRSAHMTVFTHTTPESPRTLIESLIGGTPIVGYDSEYARDLVWGTAAGAFVPVGEWESLGELIARLASDRRRLAQMMMDAAERGSHFTDVAVFRERSLLIKQHLSTTPPKPGKGAKVHPQIEADRELPTRQTLSPQEAIFRN